VIFVSSNTLENWSRTAVSETDAAAAAGDNLELEIDEPVERDVVLLLLLCVCVRVCTFSDDFRVVDTLFNCERGKFLGITFNFFRSLREISIWLYKPVVIRIGTKSIVLFSYKIRAFTVPTQGIEVPLAAVMSTFSFGLI
jgi:hypothetical protein